MNQLSIFAQYHWEAMHLSRPRIQSNTANLPRASPIAAARAVLDHRCTLDHGDEFVSGFPHGDADEIVDGVEEMDEVVEVPLQLAKEIDRLQEDGHDLFPLGHIVGCVSTNHEESILTYILFLEVDLGDLRHDIAQLTRDLHELLGSDP